ncbi:isocitrate lyase/phosphoenolpyruvate mutase family protein [Streptomyces sp. NPDC059637]|uniref:isocitrate lyase/PEP mutase family protein n=1 Tax=Streptomyces sp. NPDC059637 TaxID=3347752 RepID=UPI003673BC65
MPARTSAEAFRALHDRAEPDDPLVLPNVWDAVSARAFADGGFPALATSSSAVAAVLGYEDGEHTPPDEMFAALRRIVRAVDVPVTADIEAGYGLAPAEIVERLLEAGAVGCNLEDSDPATGELEDPREHADRLAGVSAAAAGRLVINARIDTFLHGDGSVESAVRRGRLYAGAGADVVYPILAPAEALPDLAEGLRVPVNALCLPGGPAPARLGRLGASRVTFGGGLHRQATAGLRDLVRRTASPAGADA